MGGTERGGQREWTTREIEVLRRNASLGARAVADLLGRSVWSVKQKARALRISLRPVGQTRGKVMGEPRRGSFGGARSIGREVALLRQLRADLLEGRIDHADLEARARRLGRVPLCPGCGRRPADVASTGLCRPCHVERFLDAYRQDLDARETDRLLARERQRRRRQRLSEQDAAT